MWILRNTTTQFVWNYKVLLTDSPISRRSSECVGTMAPFCLRVMEMRNIAGMLSCCQRASAATLESAARVAGWIYSCLISTAIIQRWLPNDGSEPAWLCVEECSADQSRLWLLHASMWSSEVKWLRLRSHVCTTIMHAWGWGAGGVFKRAVLFVFSADSVTLFPLSFIFWTFCGLFRLQPHLFLDACAPKSHFLDILRRPCPTSGYLHLGSWVCAYTCARVQVCLAFPRKSG